MSSQIIASEKLDLTNTLSATKSDWIQLSASLAFGLIIIFTVGFAPMEAVHNAAHDTRHTVAFPCH